MSPQGSLKIQLSRTLHPMAGSQGLEHLYSETGPALETCWEVVLQEKDIKKNTNSLFLLKVNTICGCP